MKKWIMASLVLACSLVTTIFPQTNSFKVKLEGYNIGFSHQLPNGDFYVYATNSNSKSTLVRFNSTGQKIWQVFTPYVFNKGPFVVSGNRIQGFYLTYSKSVIITCSENGIISTDSSNKRSAFYGKFLKYKNDKYFYVESASNTNKSLYKIFRYNINGQLELSFDFNGKENAGVNITVLDTTIVVSSPYTSKSISVLNWNGKFLFQNNYEKEVNAIYAWDQNSFICGFESLLIFNDNKGKEISRYNDTNHYIRAIVPYRDNSFLIMGENCKAINLSGTLLWQKQLSTPSSINVKPIYTLDDGFIFFYKDCLYKVDSSFTTDILDNLQISSQSKIYPQETIWINWLSTFADKGILEYSLDNGVIWNFLSEVNLIDGYFQWFVPRTFSSQCKLRLTKISAPAIKIESNTFSFDQLIDSPNALVINNVHYYYKTDGTSRQSFWIDKESKIVQNISSDGLNWIGTSNGEIKFGGSHYSTGLVPGNIIKQNVRANPNDPRMKSWKFYKNWDKMPESLLRDSYDYNLIFWPVDLGAPWNDYNRDNIYNPENGEIPLKDEDELHWMVMNDLDTANCNLHMLNSNPLGLEVQLSIYGYKDRFPDVIFKRYLLINKSNSVITNMYLSNWSDDDIGDPLNNAVGTDSSLNLAYTYNYNYNTALASSNVLRSAIGHMTLQGPIVKGINTENAIFRSKLKPGYKNLNANSIVFISRHDSKFPGRYEYLGSPSQILNIFRGLNTKGEFIINPETNKPTTFCFSGDPETGTGWLFKPFVNVIDNDDACYAVTTGPFNLAPLDSQEIVIAVLFAQGTTPKNAVTEIKKLAKNLKNDYYSTLTNIKTTDALLPNEFELYQNYPNPFNPSTLIKYSIPKSEHVTVKIFDVLGREVATLVDELLHAGTYQFNFDSSENRSLSSGVYFYTLKAGKYFATKKMIILK